eukprot:gene20276-biopygen13090
MLRLYASALRFSPQVRPSTLHGRASEMGNKSSHAQQARMGRRSQYKWHRILCPLAVIRRRCRM